MSLSRGLRARMLLAAGLVAAAALSAYGARSAAATGQAVGDTLTIAYPGAPATLDPGTGQNAYDDWVDVAYDCLMIAQPDGTFKPSLATKWSYGPRNESFNVTLRKGVRFSDGATFNAAAFKTWLDHVMKIPGGNGPTYLNTMTNVRVTGPYSLQLKFSSPTPLLPQVFSQLLEIGCPASPAAVKANTLNKQTAGAGEYMLDPSASVIGSKYVYVPNPYYRDKAAIHWKRIVITSMIDPSATIQALRTGQIQVATHQPVSSADAARGSGLGVTAPLQNYFALALLDRDGKVSKPLGDLRVRQAINYAIDRKAVSKAVFGGYGVPTDQPSDPGNDSNNRANEKLYPYDPAKARQLLAAAGYANGFKLQALTANAVGLDIFAQAVAGQLAKVGITLDLDVATNIGDYIGGLASGKYAAAAIGFGGLPAYFMYKLIWGPDGPIFNPFHTNDPKLAALYQKLITASPEAAGPIAQQMGKYVVQQAWFAPVAANRLVAFYSPKIAGVLATKNRAIWYIPEIRPRG